MKERKQVTIRSVKKSTYAMLQEVQSTSHMPLGVLLDEAVEFWFDHLPEEGGTEENFDAPC